MVQVGGCSACRRGQVSWQFGRSAQAAAVPQPQGCSPAQLPRIHTQTSIGQQPTVPCMHPSPAACKSSKKIRT